MLIDWSHFTPSPSLSGGLLIGVAASLLILLNGRIAGICGILGGLLRFSPDDKAWRLAFIAGLITAPLVWQYYAPLPEIQIDAGYLTLAFAGFIVGLGASYGSGCTSGHGVCGISRLSPRSIIATLLFMASGITIVYVVRHLFLA